MAQRQRTSIAKALSDAGRYPLDAYQFLKDGLDYTVQKLHGDPPLAWEKVIAYMHRHGVDPERLCELHERRKLPASIAKLLEELGGPGVLENRHVSGPQLCDGLRDLARERWGLLAGAVLRHWNVRTTRDFGLMVFALVRAGMLKKRAEDRIEDFEGVYDFEEAFERSYRISTVAEA